MKKIFDKAEKNEVRNHVVDELGDFIAITGAKFKYQVLSAWYVYSKDSCFNVGNEPRYRQVKSHGQLILGRNKLPRFLVQESFLYQEFMDLLFPVRTSHYYSSWLKILKF